MKKPIQPLLLILVALSLALAIQSCQKSGSGQESEPQANTLTDEEKAAGWQLLFDGTTLDGWKRYNHDTIGPLWSVQEGAIVCDGTGLGEGSVNGGSLMTTRQFGNFDLTVDWKISMGGNSGIIYHVVEKPELAHDYETGPEYQVMDDFNWKDSLDENQKAGSNYGMYAAPPTKKLMPVGEWNTARIVYSNGHVEHWLNGEKTVEFEEGSDDYNERMKNGKWAQFPAWNTFKVGSISLQDHGAPVYFRNIKIREL